jgi:hypothetical protein
MAKSIISLKIFFSMVHAPSIKKIMAHSVFKLSQYKIKIPMRQW